MGPATLLRSGDFIKTAKICRMTCDNEKRSRRDINSTTCSCPGLGLRDAVCMKSN